MQFVNYFFASIISFSGLLTGLILTRIAPEEQKPLKKYFDITRKIMLVLIFAFLFFYSYNNHLYFAVLTAYFAFLLFIEYKINDLPKRNIIIYILLGILFFLSSKNTNLFVIESSLVLLYGLPTASLIYDKKRKNEYKTLLYNVGFLIITNLLFFT